MECERCHRQRESGATYRFYYGRKGVTTTSFEAGARVRRTPYSIAGQDGAWICSRCVNLLYIPGIAVGLLVFGILLTASLFPEVNLPNVICCGGIGAAFLVMSLLARREWGESLAIRVKRPALVSQGHTAFFTTLGHRFLQKG